MHLTKSFALLALPLLAVATPTAVSNEARTDTLPASQCNTGPVQCCNTVTTASDPAAAGILAILGVVIQDITAAVGLTCSPVSVIGAGGAGCSANPVCCEDNSHDNLISIGCIPVDLSL